MIYSPVSPHTFLLYFFFLRAVAELGLDAQISFDGSGRPVCQEGTRIDILEEIISWAHDHSSVNVGWLRGPAGSGKSTIAGAYTFYTRAKSNPGLVLRMLAYQLARHSPIIARYMFDAAKDMDIVSASMENQFETLFRKALTEAAKEIDSPIVIILDALDECGTIQDRRGLMQVLGKLHELPKTFRFLITSRPKTDIENTLRVFKTIALNPDSADSRDDVYMFLGQDMPKACEPDTKDFPGAWSWDNVHYSRLLYVRNKRVLSSNSCLSCLFRIFTKFQPLCLF